jgi:hypothetical protein
MITWINDVKVITGNFNAQIGVEDFMKEVAGKYTIHDTSNENGQMLGYFAIRNKLKIRSTCFPHKLIHLGT